MSDRLERRYRRLLRAYPADYRAERGDELVGTYLDTVTPDRNWPGIRDAADVLAGGFRQRLRARGASGLPGGVSIAAVLALAVPSRPGRVVRWVPLVAALVPAVPVVRNQYAGYWIYAYLAPRLFIQVAAPLLLLATVIVVVYLLVRRDARALWVPLAVLPPLTLMSVDLTIYLGAVLTGDRPAGYLPWAVPIWFERSAISVVSTIVTVGVLWLAVALSGRRRPSAAAGEGSTPR